MAEQRKQGKSSRERERERERERRENLITALYKRGRVYTDNIQIHFPA